MKNVTPLFLIVAFFITTAATAATTQMCRKQYANGNAPVIINKSLADETTDLCFSEFAIKYSGKSRTPLWSAEFLTKERVSQAACLVRKDAFHEETRLSEDQRSTLEDYKRSGWDRGHMSPNHDMSTKTAQRESFSLANIVPQSPPVNQKIWRKIEGGVRAEVQAGRSLYVITGPIFDGEELEILNDRVLIPSSVFKAVYDPNTGEGAAYIATNEKDDKGTHYSKATISKLEAMIGINLFPDMSVQNKMRMMMLPTPDAEAVCMEK